MILGSWREGASGSCGCGAERCHEAALLRHDACVRGSRIILGLLAPLALLASSCTGPVETTPPSSTNSLSPQPSPSLEPVTDFSSFSEGLDAAGLTVRRGERGGADFLSDFITVPGQGFVIEDDQVLAFEFPTAKAFDEMRSTIRPRGDTIGTAIINWGDPPRFFGAGRLLVLYFGDKQHTLDTLESFLGQQFAGS